MLDNNEMIEKINAMDSEEFRSLIVQLLVDAGVGFAAGEAGLPESGLDLDEEDIEFVAPVQIPFDDTPGAYIVQSSVRSFALSELRTCFDNDTTALVAA